MFVASVSLQSRDDGGGGWRSGNCAAEDNVEGCSGFCRASSLFQSHSTVKRWDLTLVKSLEWLPEE